MTDIPEDIKRVARGIGEDWFGIGHHDSYMLAAQIEAAVSAERERCAGVVPALARNNDCDDPWENGWNFALDAVSIAIRSPERAGE
jgi:hypothetical protein